MGTNIGVYMRIIGVVIGIHFLDFLRITLGVDICIYGVYMSYSLNS